jgi:hypothetical protein
MTAYGSQQVRWWDLREGMRPDLAAVGDWPMAGTQAWFDLDDSDPRKMAALLDAAQHWVLRVETCQQARAEASHDISAATDWAAIAHEIRGRTQLYAERPWLKRTAS